MVSEGEESLKGKKTYASDKSHEHGEDPTGVLGIFAQDLSRMKAMLLNNIATCFFHIGGDLTKAEYFNDLALMEDPDYAKAMLRKVYILQKKGDYKEACSIAGFAIMRFDDDFEDERNRKIVPELK